MNDMESLLGHVQRTNPGMTADKLAEELEKCRYSAIALVMVWMNEKE